MWKSIKCFIVATTIISLIAAVIAFFADRKKRKAMSSVHKYNGLYEKYVKRSMDVFLSVGALIVFSPIIMILALLVRLKLGSPVIFCQERPGMIDPNTKKEKIFKLYKFRTMTSQCDEEGNLLPDTERLTEFGKALRSSSLDELPELINIIKGDMSIIGPRALLVRYLPAYTEYERHRHDVRPGLSGLAQINGRNYLSWDKRLQLDTEYAHNITFCGDAKIVLSTIKKVVFKEDVAVNTEEIDEGYLDEVRNVKNEV